MSEEAGSSERVSASERDWRMKSKQDRRWPSKFSAFS